MKKVILNLKVKILIGALIVVLVLVGGKLIWNLFTCRDICYGNKVQPQVPTDFGFSCATVSMLVCSKKCGAECETHKDCPKGFICNFEDCRCIPEIQLEKQVTITTDKTEYGLGETIRIIVKNNLDKPIWFYGWSEFTCVGGFSIGKKEKGYKEFYPLATEKCLSPIVKLEPKSERVYKLNLSLSTPARKHWEEYNVELLGTFKFKFNYFLNETSAQEHHINEAITIYSNEFTIRKRNKEETSKWKTYTNKEYGFEIKYPKGNQCEFSEIEEGSFSFGRIELSVLDSKGLNLNDYVDKFIADNDWTIEIRETTTVANREGIKLIYRFGGANRYGEVTFVKNNGNIYAIGYTSGIFLCNEPEIFPKMLSTFRFLK